VVHVLVALAFCLPRPARPGTPAPPPAITVTATTTPDPALGGGDTGGFTVNPWTNFKRDVRRQFQNTMDQVADVMRTYTSTPDLGATPYLRQLWVWGRGVLTGAGIFVLVVVASAAAGLWPGLNRYAAGAVLPRVVLAVGLLGAGPALLSMVSSAGNGLTEAAISSLPSAGDIHRSMAVMAGLPLILVPLALVSGVFIELLGIVRSFLLAMFVVAGPFANASFAWPGVDRWGKSWWRSVVVLAVVLPLTQAVLAGVTVVTATNVSVNVAGSASWSQAAIVLVAVAFQAVVPLGLIVFSLKPVNSTVGMAAGMRTWRAIKATTAA
jgi:hypothetical protein